MDGIIEVFSLKLTKSEHNNSEVNTHSTSTLQSKGIDSILPEDSSSIVLTSKTSLTTSTTSTTSPELNKSTIIKENEWKGKGRWEEVDGTIWEVRSIHYPQTKEKKRSLPNYCSLLAVEVVKGNQTLYHVSDHPDCYLKKYFSASSLSTERFGFILVVNFQLMNGISLVSYLLVPEKKDDVVGRLLQQFYETDSESWRNERFKIVPHIEEGGFLVKKAVGVTPCLIGTKGKSVYYKVRLNELNKLKRISSLHFSYISFIQCEHFHL